MAERRRKPRDKGEENLADRYRDGEFDTDRLYEKEDEPGQRPGERRGSNRCDEVASSHYHPLELQDGAVSRPCERKDSTLGDYCAAGFQSGLCRLGVNRAALTLSSYFPSTPIRGLRQTGRTGPVRAVRAH